jgi:VanZ family protein
MRATFMTSSRWKLGTQVLGAVFLIVLLERLPLPRDTLLWRTLFDAGHAPLFGLFALLVLAFLRGARPADAGARPYAIAFVAASAAGVLTELYQYFGPRDASLLDALRDAAGAASFLLVALSRRRIRRNFRRLAAGTAIALLSLVLVPSFQVILAYGRRASDFPVLCRFDSGWERHFLVSRLASFRFAAAPYRWEESPSATVGRIGFSGWRFPSLTLLEVEENWSGHETLAFEAFVMEPVDLTVRLEELGHRPRPDDRFDFTARLVEGHNSVRIPLASLHSVDGRPLATTRMCHITWFLADPSPTVVYIDDLRLR